MRQLAIIPCGKKKIWDKDPTKGPVTVAEAYCGVLHHLTRAYAEKFCTDWVILSAKYGYCSKNDIIKGNYDLTFRTNNTHLVISHQTLMNQIKQKKLDQYDQIIALTGQKHKKIIDRTFNSNVPLFYPLLGTKGIGDMQRRLKQAIVNNKSIH
ncbi:DUF6884 domain-containing protein [Amphibacillus sediminis]|uniref:DUF6884 domain-containing protein n=1 Tax=Amphibacillus sediminis TaxID=360185 RepID=UPI0008359849|nr:DUF6884 domain-containing protein [Amphibacillus sediminis]